MWKTLDSFLASISFSSCGSRSTMGDTSSLGSPDQNRPIKWEESSGFSSRPNRSFPASPFWFVVLTCFNPREKENDHLEIILKFACEATRNQRSFFISGSWNLDVFPILPPAPIQDTPGCLGFTVVAQVAFDFHVEFQNFQGIFQPQPQVAAGDVSSAWVTMWFAPKKNDAILISSPDHIKLLNTTQTKPQFLYWIYILSGYFIWKGDGMTKFEITP